MKKLLSLLGSVAIVGGSSAAIMAYRSPSTQQETAENPIEAARKELGNNIEIAKSMIKVNHKEPEAIEALKAAVAKAEEIFNKQNATAEELKAASVALEKAMDDFNDSPNNAIGKAKATLHIEINKANDLIAKSRKEWTAYKALQKAAAEATKVVIKKDADLTEAELKDATVKLAKAIEDFNKADDIEIAVAKKTLQVKINEATSLVKNSKKEAAVTKALQNAIDQAKVVLTNTKATEKELNTAVMQLTKAINDFKEAK